MILDPLLIIILLAVLAYKPIGTKIYFKDNLLCFNEPGLFQSIARSLSGYSKNDHYLLYNPIHFACKHFLSHSILKRHPLIKDLFLLAITGIQNLIKTYDTNEICKHNLFFYQNIIQNYINDDEAFNTVLFKADNITPLYTPEILQTFYEFWTNNEDNKIKLVLNCIDFLNNANNEIDSNNGISALQQLVLSPHKPI
jgi:hypothetical protein